MEKKVKYRANGVVYGYTWGGGKSSYPSRIIKSDTLEDLEKQIENGIFDKSLDSGAGFESLIAAMMNIVTITTIVVDGDIYTNSKYAVKVYGEPLSNKDKEFLEDEFYNL